MEVKLRKEEKKMELELNVQNEKMVTQYEEMEVVEELGDGAFLTGVAVGIAIGGAIILT